MAGRPLAAPKRESMATEGKHAGLAELEFLAQAVKADGKSNLKPSAIAAMRKKEDARRRQRLRMGVAPEDQGRHVSYGALGILDRHEDKDFWES